MSPLESGLSPIEYHLLLALASGEMHGYALRDAVESESRGAVVPRAGTLYRVLARMMGEGLVREGTGPNQEVRHPGRARRYYALTALGREALQEETRRLRLTMTLAERRLRTGG